MSRDESGLYHVTTRGWGRRTIVRSDRDLEDWLRLLDRVAIRRGRRLYAWAWLSNHFHLYLRTPESNISAGVHDLNFGYASPFLMAGAVAWDRCTRDGSH